jgi:steroid delta-isomerase-like uncharacterized protein
MKLTTTYLLLSIILLVTSCDSTNKQVEKNIKMYTNTWDEIINNGKLELFNETNFDKDIILIMSPENLVGIDNVKDFYSNYLTGFSNITFTVVDVFGQGHKIVKHWNFKGVHSGDFFGIPATGKSVDISGVTLVKIKDGKIFQEQDFMDNLVFMMQLGIDPLLNTNNLAVIEKVYVDFAKGNIPEVLSAMADDIEWNEAENFPYADGNPYVGSEAVLNGVFKRIGEEWEYWNLTNLKYQQMTNDKILTTGRYDAKYKKNGRKINMQMAHLWTLNDGKITSFQQFADTKAIAEAISK